LIFVNRTVWSNWTSFICIFYCFLCPYLLKLPLLLSYVTFWFCFLSSWWRVSPGNVYFLEHAIFFWQNVCHYW